MREVKTCPCPVCKSLQTRAFVENGFVYSRFCIACSWEWDNADGDPDGYLDSVVDEIDSEDDFEDAR